MTDHNLTIDLVEALDDGSFAAWGTVDDTAAIMGYGDTRQAAIADLRDNAPDFYAHAPEDDPPPPADPVDFVVPDAPIYSFAAPLLGSGLLTGNHDLLA
jgi:hypothetical protein